MTPRSLPRSPPNSTPCPRRTRDDVLEPPAPGRPRRPRARRRRSLPPCRGVRTHGVGLLAGLDRSPRGARRPVGHARRSPGSRVPHAGGSAAGPWGPRPPRPTLRPGAGGGRCTPLGRSRRPAGAGARRPPPSGCAGARRAPVGAAAGAVRRPLEPEVVGRGPAPAPGPRRRLGPGSVAGVGSRRAGGGPGPGPGRAGGTGDRRAPGGGARRGDVGVLRPAARAHGGGARSLPSPRGGGGAPIAAPGARRYPRRPHRGPVERRARGPCPRADPRRSPRGRTP